VFESCSTRIDNPKPDRDAGELTSHCKLTAWAVSPHHLNNRSATRRDIDLGYHDARLNGARLKTFKTWSSAPPCSD
jgi:hypothetical protein